MGPILTSFIHYNHKQLRKLAHALVGHTFDVDKDFVIVTGGASGLGKAITIEFASIGAKIAVLDTQVPCERESVSSVRYFKCDVSDSHQIESQYDTIKSQMGKPTVLINNAGVATGKPVEQLTFDEIDRVIKVNLISSFYTVKVFLPDMLRNRRGYVVNIGSTLAYMSPSQLSTYGASKAGLVALHESLTYELGPPLHNQSGVKTLLICPGQMKTAMFNGVHTPSLLLAPELEPQYVAKKIVEALLLGRRGELKFPFYGNLLPIFRAMPWPVAELARNISGMDKSMKTFRESMKVSVSRIVSKENSQNGSIISSLVNSPISAVTI